MTTREGATIVFPSKGILDDAGKEAGGYFGNCGHDPSPGFVQMVEAAPDNNARSVKSGDKLEDYHRELTLVGLVENKYFHSGPLKQHKLKPTRESVRPSSENGRK